MIHLSSDPLLKLPTAEELPHSDETPVDNELQNDIPNFILNLLRLIWEERQDWFFGVDMAIHYQVGTPAIVPDGFLSVGVPRHTGEAGRLSYVLWQEGNVLPILALEVVSQKYNGEYEEKFKTYQDIGILYYAVYNPLTKKKRKYKSHLPLEIYKLVDDAYQLVPANEQGVVWIPEISLGMGCEVRDFASWEREWLYLYDQAGNRYLAANEIVAQERLAKQKVEAAGRILKGIAKRQRLIASQQRQEKEKLAAYLRSLGINPDEIL